LRSCPGSTAPNCCSLRERQTKYPISGYRTTHARIGTPPHIGERLINHISGVTSDVEEIYDVWTYLPEMRKAVENYETHIRQVLRI